MKLRLLSSAMVIAVTCQFASCDQQATQNASPAATISASPNPIPAGSEGAGKTTISWNTGGTDQGAVYVYTEDGAENLFAAGVEGSKDVDWIQPGTSCEFRLYLNTDRKTLLTKVEVSAQDAK